MILEERPSKLLETFLDEYLSIHKVDRSKALECIKDNSYFEELTDRWYEYLLKDVNLAYSVYNEDYYFSDLWNCFITYSRSYLKNIQKPKFEGEKNIFDLLSDVNATVDIGCGIGYSTAGLKSLFPDAECYGVNLRETKQWDFCELQAKKYNFKMVGDISEIPGHVDLILASEYFEHIINPLEHLTDIVDQLNPKCFIVANAFNTRSIGHFITYQDRGSLIDQSEIGRMFNKKMEFLGYKKQSTTFFNNRPAIFIKTGNTLF